MMDQYAIIMSVAGKALWLDCRSLSHELVPVSSGKFGFYLVNTNVKHELVDSPYNKRRLESEQALDSIRQNKQDPSLEYRDITEPEFYTHNLNEILLKRAKHIILENRRVVNMVSALKNNDPDQIGRLLLASHQSLSNDYEVSCPELDFLIASSSGIPGWKGGRMMGGGFGGCTINLIEHDLAEGYHETLSKVYYEHFGIRSTLIPASSSSGLHIL